MEPKNYEARYSGILMIRGVEKLYRIRREDLLEIYRGILFDHYFPWYRDFFGEKTADYHRYLQRLYQHFESSMKSEPVIKVNGPEADVLIAQRTLRPRTPEFTLALYLLMFVVTVVLLATVLYILKTPPYLSVPVLLALLAVFAGIVATSRGRALDVWERVISVLPNGKRKLRYPPKIEGRESSPRRDLPPQSETTGSPDRSSDTPN